MRAAYTGCMAAVAAACGGVSDPTVPFAGVWTGTLTLSPFGEPGRSDIVSLAIEYDRNGRLQIAEICENLTGQAPQVDPADRAEAPVEVASPTTIFTTAYRCPPVPTPDCSAVAFQSSDGNGVLTGVTLSLEMNATLEGCSRTTGVVLHFAGKKGGTREPKGTPPSVALSAAEDGVVGQTVALDASQTRPGAGFPLLEFSWTLVSAPPTSAASLEGTSSPVVHLTPDVPGVYTARVVVSQGLLSAFASIRLSAR